MFFKITRIWCSVNGEPPDVAPLKKRRLLLPPKNHLENHFPEASSSWMESFFRREAIDFRHFRPQMLRHCLGKYKTRNPFAQKPPQWTAHRKTFQMQRTCRFKGAMESLENCSMWKYRMSWRFHAFRLFQKTRSWFELPSDPLFGWIPNWKIKKKSLWTLLNFF